jgi:hypothetical protein
VAVEAADVGRPKVFIGAGQEELSSRVAAQKFVVFLVTTERGSCLVRGGCIFGPANIGANYWRSLF